jgi:hypothetical protein
MGGSRPPEPISGVKSALSGLLRLWGPMYRVDAVPWRPLYQNLGSLGPPQLSRPCWRGPEGQPGPILKVKGSFCSLGRAPAGKVVQGPLALPRMAENIVGNVAI